MTRRVNSARGAKITEREAVLEMLPAVSMARARRVLAPGTSVTKADQLLVPVAAKKLPLFN